MFLFPEAPRDFPGHRAVKICLRAIHVLCASVFTGTYVLDVTGDPRTTWCIAAVASGTAILAVDLFESGAFLLQVRGLVVLAKVALVAALPHTGAAAPWVVGTVVVVSVISSHAPSRVRYFVVFGRGRVRAARTRG